MHHLSNRNRNVRSWREVRPHPGTKSEAQTERRKYTEGTPELTRFRVVTGSFSQHHLGDQWVPAQRLRRHLSTTPRDRAKSPAGFATAPWLRGEAIGCPSPGRCPSERPPNLTVELLAERVGRPEERLSRLTEAYRSS